jgi:hypothetical protein
MVDFVRCFTGRLRELNRPPLSTPTCGRTCSTRPSGSGPCLPPPVGPDQDAHVVEVWLLAGHDYLRRDWHGVELAEHVPPSLSVPRTSTGTPWVEAHAHD